jgi:hypothetical protein
MVIGFFTAAPSIYAKHIFALFIPKICYGLDFFSRSSFKTAERGLPEPGFGDRRGISVLELWMQREGNLTVQRFLFT